MGARDCGLRLPELGIAGLRGSSLQSLRYPGNLGTDITWGLRSDYLVPGDRSPRLPLE